MSVGRGLPTFALRSLVLFAPIERVAIVIGRAAFRIWHLGIQELPYHAAQERTEPYSWEADRTQGIRPTPCAECGPTAFRVSTFGGPAILGWEARDGDVSTGSLAALMHSFQAGHATLGRIAPRVEGRDSPLLTWARGTRTYALEGEEAEIWFDAAGRIAPGGSRVVAQARLAALEQGPADR